MTTTAPAPEVAPAEQLTEWDITTTPHDPATLCDAYPHECDPEQAHTTGDPWGPTVRTCLTHDTEGTPA